jgi:hypothetical protein
MPRYDGPSLEDLEEIRRFIGETDISEINDELRALIEMHWPSFLDKPPSRQDHLHEAQAERLLGLGEMERDAMNVLRLIVRHTKRGQKLDATLLERAKAIVESYDRTMKRGNQAPGMLPLRRKR